jgi:hypothetical protein
MTTQPIQKQITMPKLHKKKCVICQKEFLFRTGIAGRHKQIRRNYSVRFPISQTCSKKCHYIYEGVRNGIMARLNKNTWQKAQEQAREEILKEIDKCERIGNEGDNYLIDREELKKSLQNQGDRK